VTWHKNKKEMNSTVKGEKLMSIQEQEKKRNPAVCQHNKGKNLDRGMKTQDN